MKHLYRVKVSFEYAAVVDDAVDAEAFVDEAARNIDPRTDLTVVMVDGTNAHVRPKGWRDSDLVYGEKDLTYAAAKEEYAPKFGVRVVPASEIAAHPSMSFRAEDYVHKGIVCSCGEDEAEKRGEPTLPHKTTCPKA